MNRIIHTTRGAVLLLACLLAIALQPISSYASDLADIADYYGLRPPVDATPRTMSLARTIEESPTGIWIQDDSEVINGAKQVNEYRIAAEPDDQGNILIEIKTTIYNISLPTVMWTTTKTIYCDGVEVASIPENREEAGKGESISQGTSFRLSKGGVHHITSIEIPFRGGTQTKAGWDFYVYVPYVITPSVTEGGSINPDKPTYAKPGSSFACTITPDAGYRTEQVLIDGTPYGPISSFTFNNVDDDHCVAATFTKVWTVVFLDRDGVELDRVVVDDGADAAPPAIPDIEGYTSCGWDQDLTQIHSDMVVQPVYEPVITVRVPTTVACTLLPSGEVVANDSYAIENRSSIPVRTSSIEVLQQAPNTAVELLDGESVAWSTEDGGPGFSIDANASKNLTWNVAPFDAELNAELIAAAAQSPQELCLVSFTFEAE